MGFDYLATFEFKCLVELHESSASEFDAILRVRLVGTKERIAAFRSGLWSSIQVNGVDVARVFELLGSIPDVETSLICRSDDMVRWPLLESDRTRLINNIELATHAPLSGFTKLRPSLFAEIEYDKSIEQFKVQGGFYIEIQAGFAIESSMIYAQLQVGKLKKDKQRPIEFFVTFRELKESIQTFSDSYLPCDFGSVKLKNPEIKYSLSVRFPWARVLSLKKKNYKPVLFYIGIILLFGILIARVNAWPIPLIRSNDMAIAIAFFVVVMGLSHWAYKYQNISAAVGILLAAIGGWEGAFGRTIPHTPRYEWPLCVGMVLIVYGVIPAILGIPVFLVGMIELTSEDVRCSTMGFGAIDLKMVITSVVLISIGLWLVLRQRNLNRRGIFKKQN